MSVPYIGSTITLISKSEIRYVGKLVQIDQQQSTVTLQGVRSFGTEGRRGPGQPDVPPSEQVFEYIVFRGSDIKDLHVTELTAPAPPKPQGLPDDPAIVSVPKKSEVAAAVAPKQVSGAIAAVGQPKAPSIQQEKTGAPVSTMGSAKAAEANNYAAAGTHKPRKEQQGGRGGGRVGGGRGGKPQQQSQPPQQYRPKLSVPKTDYDFQSANLKLNKEEIVKEIQKDSGADDVSDLASKLANLGLPTESFYNKKTSFFDNISSETREKTERSEDKGKLSLDEVRKLRQDNREQNLETFGVAGLRQNFRGRGRGRGRGGRGRGRGGRGSYQRSAAPAEQPVGN